MNLTSDLVKIRNEIEGHAKKFGLDFFDVIFEVLDWNQINEVAALGGFPNRYPHWRFGMEYEAISKRYSYGLSKIYEMVINNDPCYAYLLFCNNIVDQKLVMAHVYAHCDFFKNNIYFAHTNRKMMDEMANHRSRIQRYTDRHGHDKVEDFIDACLSIDSLIDMHAAAIKREGIKKDDNEDQTIIQSAYRMKSKPYMDKFVNPPEYLDAQREKAKKEMEAEKKFPESPVRDVMGFLMQYAPLEPWERDILSMMREEAYYYVPQAQTKVMNEGWACVAGDTPVSTEHGLLTAREIAEKKLNLKVNDGKQLQKVYDWAIFPDRKTVKITTRRGLTLEGSETHQLQLEDGSWKRLDQVQVGDEIKIGGGGVWPEKLIEINWEPQERITLDDVAREAGVSVSTIIRHKSGQCVSRSASGVEAALVSYETQMASEKIVCNNRKEIDVPETVGEKLAAFLGYLTGDGHISRIKRVIGLTSGDYDQIERFARLGKELFGLECRVKKDGGRWRALFHSEHLSDFLESLGLKHGFSAREKVVPWPILRSPESVVASFIQAYFDCDAYAGEFGIKLSTSSTELLDQIQLLLLNFGILSTKIKQPKDVNHLCIFGKSAKRYAEKIDFGLIRKSERLNKYISDRKWFKKEEFADEIVSKDSGINDVYDFSVENSHCYVAAGLINHNSYWHSKIMTQKALHPSEIIDYADHHSGTLATSPGQLNPYKVGVELFRDIEDRWNKGKFGSEYYDCKDMMAKKNWDKNLGLGRRKIFEVRKLYNDVMFIDEFMTPEFCKEHKLFVYAYNISSDQYEIADRTFDSIKEKLLFQLTNMGRPIIDIVDANYGNKSELLLKHRHEGVDLRIDYAKEVLRNLYRIWKHPVNIDTILNGSPKIICFDGENHKEFRP